MANVPLTREQHKQLVRFIAERAGILTARDRQALLKRAGLELFLPRLYFDSDPRSFSLELVDALQDYGTLAETNQPALLSLLHELRAGLGGGAEADFLDELLAPYPPSPTPSRSSAPPLQRSSAPTLLRILFLAANPREAAALQIDQELRLIKERLREAKLRETFTLEPGLALRQEDLSLLLLENEPHIVQITGHGDPAGAILLEDASRQYQPVSHAVLVHLFATLKDEIRCVLLCVCHSAPLAQALTEHIPCVIGMEGAVEDEAARRFAAGFYRGLGFGKSVQTAFELGRNELMQVAPEERERPRLFMQPGVDPAHLYLAPGTQRRTPHPTAHAARPTPPDPPTLAPLPARSLEQVIEGYLAGLLRDFAAQVAQYVDLAGERSITRAVPQSVQDAWLEPLADLERALGHVVLDGSYCPRDEAQPKAVPNVRERLLAVERGVLLGEPGSGKSWTLLRLALDYAALWQGERPDPVPGRGPLLPILVKLRSFSGKVGEEPESMAAFVARQVQEVSPDLVSYLPRLFAEQRVVLLLDALNEMPRQADGRDLMAEVREYLRDKDYFMLSCRVRDYREELSGLGALEQLSLHDLTLPQLHEVLRRRLGEVQGAALWQAMGGSETLLGFWRRVVERGEAKHFWEAGHEWPWEMRHDNWEGYRDWQRIHREGARLIPLCRNPFMAYLLCYLYKSAHGQLPGSRPALFGRFVQVLLAREEASARQRGEVWPGAAAVEEALVCLARAMQQAAGTELERGNALAALETDKAEVLLKVALAATLLTEEGERIRFSHQLLQEYFAARTLLAAMDATENATQFFGATWWEAGVWRETMVILGEFLGERAAGPNRVARWLAPASPEVALDIILRNGEGLTLADVEPETRAALIAGAREKTAEGDPRGRAAAYRVLALLDADERPGVGLRSDGLPDITWVEIPGGPCHIGSDEGVWNSRPAGEVEVPTFWIGKYPITYRQFQAFVDAADGYKNRRWWSGLEREEPKEQWFKFWNHPRDNVSWYEAVAFCRWLSAKLGYEVRLPTEEEWEKAARGSNGLIYPYGNKFDAGKGNTGESGFGQTSAVGSFPAGASPYGVLDLSGNVWEWTSSPWEREPRPIRPQEQSGIWARIRQLISGSAKLGEPEDLKHHAKSARVLCGAAWDSDAQEARATSRYFYHSPVYNLNIGFRVVASAPWQ